MENVTVWAGMTTAELEHIRANCRRGILKAAEAYARGERGEFIEIANVISKSAVEQITAELDSRK